MATERRKPATGRIPSPSSRKPTTRVPQGSGKTTRSIPRAQGKSTGPLVIGGAVGGFILLVIIVAVAASNNTKKREAAPVKSAEPVSVAELEREGLRKCDEGLQIIQGCDSMMRGSGEKERLRTELTRGVNLITAGNQMLDTASQRTNFQNKYDTTRYNQALKLARGKLLELK